MKSFNAGIKPDLALAIFQNNRALHRPTWVVVDVPPRMPYSGTSAELVELNLWEEYCVVKIANGDLQVHELKNIFFRLAE